MLSLQLDSTGLFLLSGMQVTELFKGDIELPQGNILRQRGYDHIYPRWAELTSNLIWGR
jgi:hypothetical protein